MLLIHVDREATEPLHAQIVEKVRTALEDELLRVGERLPSTRRLAEALGVHRSTVSLAYQQLWSLGYLELRPGARPRVRPRTRIARPADRQGAHGADWASFATPASTELLEADRRYRTPLAEDSSTEPIDFASLAVDARLYPVDEFRHCLGRVAARKGAALLGYGDGAGFPPLREYLAGRLQQHGIHVDAEQILLTNGSQHGIDLLLRVIEPRGRTVVVEAPTYDYMLPLLRLHGARARALPLGEDGMDLDELAGLLTAERPALIYTMPSFQNPTGTTTSQAHRERLLALCEEHGVPLLEDGYDEEMQYSGRIVFALKSMDRRGLVAYCGTFSKVLFPGLRIGWLAAERALVARARAIRRFTEVAPNSLLQAAMNAFCRQGSFDKHVARMHRVFRRRMRVALDELQARIPAAWATWKEPAGGYLIWLRLTPCGVDGDRLRTVLAEAGVRVADGRTFYGEAPEAAFLRLSISALDETEIVEGIRRLAAGLGALYAGEGR